MKHFKKAFAARKEPTKGAALGHDGDKSPLQPSTLQPHSPPLTDDLSDTGLPHRTTGRSLTNASTSGSRRVASRSPAGSRDPFGLTVVYTPGKDYKLDIIFVHGLGGTSRMTWSRGKNIDYFWPEVFLPNEPGISDARISTFGYNSSVFKGGGRSKVSILDFAKGLLFDLKYATDDSGEKMNIGAKPIIFIVHSMGGLIVKMAYMQGLYDPEYKDIVASISSIIFLATPHRGSDFAGTLNKVLKATMIKAPKQFIDDLGKNSSTLLKLNEEFRHFAPTVGLASFYETRTTAIGTDKYQIMVVNQDSATLGYPGEISASMDADHHTICKYDSPKDPNYVKIRNYIESKISSILKPQRSRKTPSVSTDDEIQDKKLEALFGLTDSPDSDFIFFKDRCLKGTCTWILEDRTFLSWLHDDSLKPRVLWLQGQAGTGKSILSSYIINHLVTQRLDCQYFFIRFGDTKKRSLSNLLRSLSFQFAQSSPTYRKRLLRLSDEASQLRKADAQTVWQRLFRDILLKTEFSSPVYWVIDGLDECDTPRRFIKMLSELSTAALPIRVLVVSRKQRDLSTEFSRLESQVQLDTISSDGRVEDFEKYVNLELDVPGSDSYRQMIAAKIVERALGNFLWVHLAVKKINACQTAAKREQALEQLPPGMDKFFDRMAQSITDIEDDDDKKLAADILMWVTCSLRNLTLVELLQALDMAPSAMPDLQRSIEDLCAGFIVVDNSGNISLIHKTAKEYLISGDKGRPFAINREDSNAKIFMRCMKCITAIGLRAKIRMGSPPEFLDYAATSWFAHLSASSHQSELILTTLVKFLRSSAILTWIQVLAAMRKVRVLIVASTYLADYATKIKRSEYDMMPKDRQIMERETIEEWVIDLAKIAGKFGSRLVLYPESIYKLIPPFCPPESIIYKLFGVKEHRSLSISGLSATGWDDSLARLQFGSNVYASAILAVGSSIATLLPSGSVLLFNSTTFERIGRLEHGERISRMQRSASGTMLVTYGYATTKVWDLITRQQTFSAANPISKPQCMCLAFMDDDERILMGGGDRVIRTLSLHDPSSSWEIATELSKEPVEGAIVNSPSAVAISPDGKYIALGYRAHPISVWTIDGEHVGVGFRDGSENLNGRTMSTECLELRWHPHANACQVLGLYEDGIVFRWSPIDEEYCEVAASASNLTVSHDGKFIATCNRSGRVSVYNTAGLELLYKLHSKDCPFDLTFSPDGSRFYDIRGQYANVWEPSALARFSEQTERSSDSASDTDSTMAPKSTVSEVVATKLDPITVVASQPDGQLYCCGSEDGATDLFHVSKGKICSVGKSTAFFTTEKVVWSQDGSNIAYAWLNTVMIKAVVSGGDQNVWKTESVIPKPIKMSGAVLEMLFNAESNRLLVYTSSGMDVISLSEKSIVSSTKLKGPRVKWFNHPSDPKLLLKISHNTIDTLDWTSLSTIQTFAFAIVGRIPLSESEIVAHMEASPESPGSRRKPSQSTSQALEIQEVVERVLATQDGLHILLQISIPINKHERQNHILLFESKSLLTDEFTHIMDNLSISASTAMGLEGTPVNSPSPIVLQPILIPAEVALQIHIPMSFISGASRRERDKLIFLDQNGWLCSWRLSLSSDISRRSTVGVPDEANLKVVQHYFLPGDWISPACVELATLATDGTLLIPRNGEVAVVRCGAIRA